MFGLPGQTLKEWQETLGQVVRLGPDHISAYSLIIEEDTPFGDLYNKGQLEPLDDELERLMYHDCIDYLNDKGYKQYEISNFAKEGKASQHNIDCWQCRPYIGMGLGAHSYFKGHRYNNTYIIKDYIKDSARVDQIQESKEVIDLKAQIEEYMFLGLRLTNGIEIEDFKQRFNQSLWDLYGVQINQHKDQGLLAEKDGRIFLTSFGQDVSNIVFSSFL